MAENLMETQTGGAGETVQLAPETPVTPEPTNSEGQPVIADSADNLHT